MNTINRTVLLITPRKPYIEWANSIDDDGPSLSGDALHHTAILIPDTYDEYNYENWLRKNYKDIFVFELEAWMVVPESYPEMNYKVFREWFDVKVADTLIDMVIEPVETEEY